MNLRHGFILAPVDPAKETEPAGREHCFGNPVYGSHGVTSPTSMFMGSENLHEMNANRDLEPLMGGATLCGALIKP